MNAKRIHFLIQAVIVLIASHKASAENEDLIKGISITTAEPEYEGSQFNKRDLRGQIGSYNTNQPQQSSFAPNDEPFRPMYRPYYSEDQASTKYGSKLAIVPQAAEIYYDTPPSSSKNVVAKPPINAPQTSTSLPAHSGIPLAGSFLSSGGVRHNSNTFRGPLNSFVYQNEQNRLPQKSASKQEMTVKPVVSTTQESKNPQYTSTYLETNVPNQKPYYQSQQYQPNLVLQSPHYQHRQQPYYQQVYNAEQSTTTRAIPPSPQHHIQYIVAVPLSHLRQLHQQQHQQQRLPENKHGNYHASHHASVLLKTPQAIPGPLARDHYGTYQPARNTNSQIVETATKPTQQHPIQYTTQYIQLPASVLHAAIQAAHNYQQQRQHAQDHQQTASYGQVQPQYVYYPQQQQQQAHQQHFEHAPHIASAESETQKSQQETVFYASSPKPETNSLPQKEVRILPTPVPSASNPPLIDPAPLVHYNPIYVQAPPPEQQALFGGPNYNRFTSGGFQATTPVPFVRLSPVTPPHSHFYTPLQYHHPHHVQHPIHPFYRTYVPEQIQTHGLPYFTHPGGVHYGTHLFHPTTQNFVSAPTTQPKGAESANDKQQQMNTQHQYTSGSNNAATEAESETLVKYP